MNNIRNSSGIYNNNSCNSKSNNVTVFLTFKDSGLTLLNNTRINSSINVSRSTQLITTINSSLHVSGITMLNR